MRNTLSKVLPLLALTAVITAGGCSKNVHDGVNMKGRVAFGAVIPNTGTHRDLGAELYRGMLTAQHALNSAGQIEGKLVHVQLYDSTGEPLKGLDGMRRLTRDFEAPFVATALPSVVNRCAPEYAQAETLALRLEAASRGPDASDKNSIQAFVHANEEIAVMATAAKNEGWKKTLCLVIEDRYGESAGERLLLALKKAGVTETTRLRLFNEPECFDEIRETVKDGGYDSVVIFSHGREVGGALLALRKANFGGAIVGNHAFGSRAVTRLHPIVLKNVRFTAPAFHSRTDSPMTARFRHEYREFNGEAPDLYSALGYDQVMLVFSAAKHEETLDPYEIRRRILKDRTYEGAAGTYRFDADGTGHLELTLEPVAPRNERTGAII